MEFDNALLKHLVPIRQLQNENRLKLAEKSHIIGLHSGDELSANEEHRWYLYLLDGKLNMFDADGESALLSAGDKRSMHPLFSEGNYKARLLAQSNSYVIRFDRQLFNTLLDAELLSGEELETVEMSEVEGNLFNEIMHAFNMGELKLPSLPDIAVKVKKAIASPNADARDVARIVSADPAITTRLINAANGPLNRAVDPIDGIQAAIVRLGLNTCKELILGFAVKQLFITKTDLLHRRMNELYDRSIEIAAISFALSKRSGLLCSEHMLLAGLLHQIGVIPILSYIEDTGLIINGEEELDQIITRLRGVVGSMVIRHWSLPNDLVDVVENFEDWQRDQQGEIDTCDMIVIAQIYSRLKHHELEDLPRIEQVPAFKKLFPEKHDKNFATQVFEDAHAEITSVMQLLKM